MNKPIVVFFLTTALHTGGAELMLYRLLSRLDRARFAPQVITMLDHGRISRKIQALGIPVHTLNMIQGKINPGSLVKLTRLLKQNRPDVMQTWMYHADLLGGLAARFAGRIPVAWGIRQSDLHAQSSSRLTHLTVRTCAWLSHWLPTRIVCCSEVARKIHVALGYAEDKMLVIPNGYDVDAFRPDPVARESVRAELGIPEEASLIGMIARYDPQKDHQNFVQAATLLQKERPNTHFLLVGPNMHWENRELVRWIDEVGMHSCFHLLGIREDVTRLTAALDVASLTSAYGEGFPNVVSEAMSCGVPCVATDVGDAALIVGQTGIIVPPRKPSDLAMGWRTMLDLGREGRDRLGMMARKRIIEEFNLPEIVTRYENLFTELATEARA